MKKTVLLIISFLTLNINFTPAQNMTICDCVTQYAAMAEDMNNGLSEEEAMKKYEKIELECAKLMDTLGEEAFEEMSSCKDWAKLSALMIPEGADIDIDFVCGCVDLMVEAYGEYLKTGISDEEMDAKYGKKMGTCEPLFMDEAALGAMISCPNFAKLSELMMQLMESDQ
tara:strand:- start:356 stop:865 length:510 start_codon:yes stop_codon:yes gene_type:complete